MEEYVTRQGDTWDIIAYGAYGDSAPYIHLLMQSNFPLLDYFRFPAGITVNIPDLPEKEELEGRPDWRDGEED